MHIYLFAISAFLIATNAYAKQYGIYEPSRILTATETSDGKKYGVDVKYLDQILDDLESHAKNYPPEFDTPQDRERAVQNIKAVSGALDVLNAGQDPNLGLLRRAGFLNSMGHNLDIPGCAQKADSIFQRLLAAYPSDPAGNYMYGNFLGATGRTKEALSFLERALAGGITDANYSLGVDYVQLGDRKKAIENLEAYQLQNPSDKTVQTLIDGIRSGQVQPMFQGPKKP